MSAFLPGLPDLISLRQTIVNTLTAYDLLGVYRYPDASTGWAIAVEGLGYDEGEVSDPPAGTQVEGLEVAIVVAEDVPIQPTLDGYIQTYRHLIVLKEHDPSAQGRTLKSFHLLKQAMGNIYSGSAIRVLPNPQFNNVETLSFSLEQIVLVEMDDFDVFDEASPLPVAETPMEIEVDVAVAIGQPLYLKPSGTAELAIASNTGTTQVIGLALENAAAHSSCRYTSDGIVSKPDWTLITGTVTLTPGMEYFLDSEQPGKLTAIAPSTTGFVASVGRAISPQQLDIEIQPVIKL